MLSLKPKFSTINAMPSRATAHYNSPKLKLLLATSACVILSACGDSNPFSSRGSRPVPLPAETTIRDNQDRPLEIRLHYRAKDSIHFTRLSDGRKFDLPIANLSKKDKKWILKLPVSTEESRAASQRADQAAAYIQNRKKSIALIDEKIQEINNKIGSGNLPGSALRGWNNEISRKKDEIRKIEAQIKQYKADQK